MHRLARRWQRFAHYKFALPFLVVLYLVLHSGLFSLNYWVADDYLQRAYITGSDALEERGLLQGIAAGDIEFFVHNQFNFFDPQTGNDEAMRAYGALPWWTQENALLHLWRPVSSLSHWLDYQLWPDNPGLMQIHNAVLLLLAFVLVIGFYRQVMPQRALCLFAVLLFSLDLSVLMVASWVAARNSVLVMCWLPVCLWLFHASARRHGLYFVAMLVYILALLTAEAAVVIAAYLAAYVLFYQRSSIKHSTLLLLPFVIITVLWRVYYQQAGFGALNIGQYIDPGRSLLAFIQHGALQYPVLFLEALLGIDSLDLFLPSRAMPYVWVLGWLLFVVTAMVSWLRRKAQPLMLFWFAAMAFALVPGVTMYSSDPRIVFHVHMAFAGYLAVLAYDIVTARNAYDKALKRLTNGLLILLLSWQLLIQGLGIMVLNAAALMTPLFHPAQYDQRLYGFIDEVPESQHIVLLNHPDVFRLMYFPYQFAAQGRVLPPSVRVLATAQTAIRIERLSVSEYRISPEGGFILQDGDMASLSDSLRRQAEKAGSAIKYAGFFHDGNYRFVEGQSLTFAEMVLDIVYVDEQQRPVVIDMRLLQPADDYAIRFWDWQQQSYRALGDLAVGESFIVPGP